jgi:hypothetical protein
MTSYHFNEAMFALPEVERLVDHSRQFLEITTEDGSTLDLVIARTPVIEGQPLRTAVENGLTEQRRSLRAFSVLSAREREYPALHGIEVRLRFIDKSEGPIYHHEFHTLMGHTRVGFHAICAVARADYCDSWMEALLESVKTRNFGT